MKLFISWSGEESRKVAEYMYKWISERLQSVEPWASFNHDDLPQGHDNLNRIFKSARNCDLCLLILTKKSLGSSWVSFEPGMFVGRDKQVLTLLCDGLKHDELQGYPFSGYHGYPTEDSIIGLFKAINGQCGNIPDSKFTEGVSQDFKEFLKMYNDVFPPIKESVTFEDGLRVLTNDD